MIFVKTLPFFETQIFYISIIFHFHPTECENNEIILFFLSNTLCLFPWNISKDVMFTSKKAFNLKQCIFNIDVQSKTFLRIKWCHRLLQWNVIVSVIHKDKLSDNSYNIKAVYTSFYTINRLRIMSLTIMHLL